MRGKKAKQLRKIAVLTAPIKYNEYEVEYVRSSLEANAPFIAIKTWKVGCPKQVYRQLKKHWTRREFGKIADGLTNS